MTVLYQAFKPGYEGRYANILHNRLPGVLGGSGIDYEVSSLGPDFDIRVSTEASVNETLFNQVMASHAYLALSANKTTIVADDVDMAVISCSDLVIDGDSQLDYEVYGIGGLDDSGTITVADGVATLGFTAPVSDTYYVRFARQGSSNYEDGFIKIIAEES